MKWNPFNRSWRGPKLPSSWGGKIGACIGIASVCLAVPGAFVSWQQAGRSEAEAIEAGKKADQSLEAQKALVRTQEQQLASMRQLASFTEQQAQSARLNTELGRSQVEVAGKLSAATERMAATADRQSEQTRIDFQAQNRAILSVVDIVLGQLRPNFQLQIITEFQNIGQSEPRFIREGSRIYIHDRSDRRVSLLNCSSPEMKPLGNLGSGKIEQLSVEALTAEKIVEIETGQTNVDIVGAICYQDVFGGEHMTQYCYAIWANGYKIPCRHPLTTS